MLMDSSSPAGTGPRGYNGRHLTIPAVRESSEDRSKWAQKLSEPPLGTYRFGPFRVDAAKRVLLRDGEPVALTPRAFDTLLALLAHRDRVVEKDELMSLVWGDTAVEEANLTQNVFTLRKVLGEGPQEHRYIATFPRRGYQFVARVLEADPIAVAPPTHAHAARRSLAVLPFTSLGGETDQYLGLGMADALITRLGNIRQVVVRPTSAIRAYVGSTPEPVVAGRTLGVDMVLEGSIQRLGDRVRVTAQLVSVEAGAPVWGESFHEQLVDLFAVQDSISERLAAALVSNLTAEDRQRLRRRPTDDQEAYLSYLRGRHHWNARSEAGLKKAIHHFELAIARDPGYALAHAGLADCYTLLGSAGYAVLPAADALGRARAAALKALEADPELAEAHTSLALVRFRLDWDWAGAEEEFKHATDLNPGFASAHHFHGLFLAAMGRSQEAIERMEVAQQLDPLSPNLSTAAGRVRHFAGDLEGAVEQYRKTLDMDPNFPEAHFNLALVNVQLGRFAEAQAGIERAMQLAGHRPVMVAILGYMHARAGDAGRAREALRELAEASGRGEIASLHMAYIHIGLGEHDRAFERIEEGYRERAGLLVFARVEPIFDPLRADPRFADLLRRMGLLGVNPP
jgi:DNA-binding winged helix-turn-helix (wHTH) protein/tetratricopeptide (TPR) repeat protein